MAQLRVRVADAGAGIRQGARLNPSGGQIQTGPVFGERVPDFGHHSAAVAAAPFDALTRLGQTAQNAGLDYLAAEQRASEAEALGRARGEALEALDSVRSGIASDASITGTDAALSRWQNEARAVRDRIGEKLGPGAARAFRIDFAEMEATQGLNVRRDIATRLNQEYQVGLETRLATYGRRMSSAENAAERLQIENLAKTEIEGAVVARVLNPLQANEMRQKFLSGVDEADARRLIALDPATAEQRLNDPAQFPHLSEPARARLFDSALRRREAEATRAVAQMAAATAAAERAERRTERQQRLLADRAANDLWARVGAADAGQAEPPSLADVQAQREWLSPGEFRALSAAVTQRGPQSDRPEVRVDLEGRADTMDPAQFQAEVGRAVRNGDLTANTAGALIRTNRAARRDDQPASAYTSGRRFVLDGLDPGNVLFGNLMRGPLAAARQSALADFDTWAERNPNATRADAVEYGRTLVRGYQDQANAEARATLPTPYGWAGPRVDITPQALSDAARQLQAAGRAGTIPPAELVRQTEVLDAWRAALSPRQQPQRPQQTGAAGGNARGGGPARLPPARTE